MPSGGWGRSLGLMSRGGTLYNVTYPMIHVDSYPLSVDKEIPCPKLHLRAVTRKTVEMVSSRLVDADNFHGKLP